MMQKNYLIILISFLVLIFIQSVSAETLIIGAGNEGLVYANITNTTNTTNTTNSTNELLESNKQLTNNLKQILQDLKATTDEKKYLEALNERNEGLEDKYTKLVSSLEKTTKKQLQVIEQQGEDYAVLESRFETYKDTQGARITALETSLEKETLYKYFYALVAVIITILMMEWISGITKRKKLYFKLRKIRDEIPLNLGVIFGRR